MELNIPTGLPLLYGFDAKLNVKSRSYLASKEEVEQRLKMYEERRLGKRIVDTHAEAR
ncbi:MAG: hypothetical protein P4M11_10000 [Candidatus Pacebacteria bacterium]|nr:hypothetical protein [Candidatus Paceibacterota bacterium]